MGLGRLGTIVQLPDGREGTVVFNGLTGVGIKWGRHNPDPSDFEGTSADLLEQDEPEDFQWEPDAMLRDKSMENRLRIPCVGEERTVRMIRHGLHEWLDSNGATS